ncbi:N-acetyl-gamma-glutamyl-phosphate reductase [soil metagenome]
MTLTTAVLGASGYAGGELIRLLDGHPHFEVAYLGGHASEGSRLGDVHPQLPGGERLIGSNDSGRVGDVDVVFLALPHGASAGLGSELRKSDAVTIDLGSDFRLDTPERYRLAYGSEHPHPTELGEWSYGLPELFELKGAREIASPGCYPTAVLLAIVPLLDAGLVDPAGIVADCLSGTSGAGRGVREDLMFGAVDAGVRSYGVTTHRHRPEIEMALDLRLGGEHRLVFTPHLVPMQRGLLATVTARGESSTAKLRAALRDSYASAPFVEVVEQPPQTRWTVSSNRALVTAFADERTGSVIAQCAIDNLIKGASGQAIQAANIAVGFAEADGLPIAGWMP